MDSELRRLEKEAKEDPSKLAQLRAIQARIRPPLPKGRKGKAQVKELKSFPLVVNITKNGRAVSEAVGKTVLKKYYPDVDIEEWGFRHSDHSLVATRITDM